MSPEQIILTISQLCGWVVNTEDGYITDPCGHEWQTYKDGSDILPQYPYSHSDINEAVEALICGDVQKEMHYSAHFCRICCGVVELSWCGLNTSQRMKVMLATPLQKCEALLRTLNLWEK